MKIRIVMREDEDEKEKTTVRKDELTYVEFECLVMVLMDRLGPLKKKGGGTSFSATAATRVHFRPRALVSARRWAAPQPHHGFLGAGKF